MKLSNLAPALALPLALALAADPALAQGSRRGGGGGGSQRGGAPRGGGVAPRSHPSSGSAVRVRPGPSYAAQGRAAQLRHPRAGTGTGSRGPYYYYGPSHGGHYPGHGGGYYGNYRPYYGGYYRPYYGGYYGPYFSGSFYYGWPYYSAAVWPYASVAYYDAPSYTVYSDPPPSYRYRDEGSSTAPARSTDAPRAPDADSGRVRLEVRPEDASVYVNDEFRGTAAQARLLSLPPGRYTIELVRPGYATELRQVDVVKGGSQDVLVELQRR